MATPLRKRDVIAKLPLSVSDLDFVQVLYQITLEAPQSAGGPCMR